MLLIKIIINYNANCHAFSIKMFFFFVLLFFPPFYSSTFGFSFQLCCCGLIRFLFYFNVSGIYHNIPQFIFFFLFSTNEKYMWQKRQLLIPLCIKLLWLFLFVSSFLLKYVTRMKWTQVGLRIYRVIVLNCIWKISNHFLRFYPTIVDSQAKELIPFHVIWLTSHWSHLFDDL